MFDGREDTRSSKHLDLRNILVRNVAKGLMFVRINVVSAVSSFFCTAGGEQAPEYPKIATRSELPVQGMQHVPNLLLAS
jgi:hypothetical protein